MLSRLGHVLDMSNVQCLVKIVSIKIKISNCIICPKLWQHLSSVPPECPHWTLHHHYWLDFRTKQFKLLHHVITYCQSMNCQSVALIPWCPCGKSCLPWAMSAVSIWWERGTFLVHIHAWYSKSVGSRQTPEHYYERVIFLSLYIILSMEWEETSF